MTELARIINELRKMGLEFLPVIVSRWLIFWIWTHTHEDAIAGGGHLALHRQVLGERLLLDRRVVVMQVRALFCLVAVELQKVEQGLKEGKDGQASRSEARGLVKPVRNCWEPGHRGYSTLEKSYSQDLKAGGALFGTVVWANQIELGLACTHAG